MDRIKIDRVSISEKPRGVARTIGLYINGALYYEGYSIPDRVWMDLLEEAGCQTRSFSDEESIDARWAEQTKTLPASFDEIKFRGNVSPNGIKPPLPEPEPVVTQREDGTYVYKMPPPEIYDGSPYRHYEDPNR